MHDSLEKCADKKQCRCCLLSMLHISRALGSEGLALGSDGNRRELSTGTCLNEAGIEPGTVASESSEARRSYFPCPMTVRPNARIKSSVGAAFYPCCTLVELLVANLIGERRESSGLGVIDQDLPDLGRNRTRDSSIGVQVV